MQKLEKVGVLGAGMMGAEIGLCFAKAGCQVVIKDETMELANKGKERLSTVLDKAIKKGRFEADKKDATLDLITPADSFDPFADVDFVTEAVFEDLQVKETVYRQVDEVCKPECVFASNTSSISITRLSNSVKPERRSRFLGTHYFSPASIMKLVEVIPALETEEEVISLTMEAMKTIGKTPIRVKDVTGFLVNRILHAMICEANRLLEEGVATVEDIDTGMKLGLGHPLGPFELMDLTDVSLSLRVQEILHAAYGERFLPSQMLRQKVDAGHLGRKTGQGWYKHDKR
jgi:3-hydroxybutyryl-CoA dehydrogenase